MFTFASVLSLLLCLATAVLWVRSYRSCDILKRTIGSRWLLFAVMGDGQMRFSLTHYVTRPIPFTFDYRSWRNSGGVQEWMVSSGLGVMSAIRENKWWDHLELTRMEHFEAEGPDYQIWYIALPGWLGMTVFSVLPLVALLRLRRSRPVLNPRLCQNCGYNLTGNASGICPECGTAVPQKAAA